MMGDLIYNSLRQQLMVSSTSSSSESHSLCLVLHIVKNAPNTDAVPIKIITPRLLFTWIAPYTKGGPTDDPRDHKVSTFMPPSSAFLIVRASSKPHNVCR